MAEIEIPILERNALSRRLEDEASLFRQVLAVETERNARRKLERLCPVKEPPLIEG